MMSFFIFEGVLNLLHCQLRLGKQGGCQSSVVSPLEQHRDQNLMILIHKQIGGCSTRRQCQNWCQRGSSGLVESLGFSSLSYECCDRLRSLLLHCKQCLQSVVAGGARAPISGLDQFQDHFQVIGGHSNAPQLWGDMPVNFSNSLVSRLQELPPALGIRHLIWCISIQYHIPLA